MMVFESSRLITARRRRGLSQKDLALSLGLSPRRFNSYECGVAPPTTVIQKIAEALDFPVEFFLGPEVEDISTEFVSFRAMSKMTARMRDKALASASMAIMATDWLDQQFNVPAPELPDLRGSGPEVAADTVRHLWGLGDKPIKNMIHLLESKGVRVFSLTTEPREIDAFCFRRGDVPFIFLNTTKSAERARFDAAHELGHLILHRHGHPAGIEAEQEADKFASAFLMPKSGVIANCYGMATLPALLQKKSIWLVSLSALVYRLHSLSLLSDWHYRQLYIEISKRGFKKSEPNGIPHESSQLFKKVVELLRSENKSLSQLSTDLHIGIDDINSLFFGLVLTAVTSDQFVSTPKRWPDLRLVE